ncbi:hypothetical protein V5P93_000351 [Actinokineospora auranticolor]|uniref:hypothetical protein n=1 Tax=Actinokineospora auranticolor TaxID=155976 RepID=UPI0011B076FE|nr:hypothetical protein [Actinokineospora auranticolor]
MAVSGDAHVFVDTFDRFTAWARLLGATSLDAWTSRDRVTILVKGRVDGIDITVFGELPHLPGLGEKTERFPLAVLDTVTGAEMAVAA